DRGGRIHRLADGFAPHICRRPWFWNEVGHGVDARHTFVFFARSYPSQISPQPADVPYAVWLHREFCSSAFTRRGGAWQGIAAEQNARRAVAEVCQPAPAVRLHVRA